jgi:hypothetical protein
VRTARERWGRMAVERRDRGNAPRLFLRGVEMTFDEDPLLANKTALEEVWEASHLRLDFKHAFQAAAWRLPKSFCPMRYLMGLGKHQSVVLLCQKSKGKLLRIVSSDHLICQELSCCICFVYLGEVQSSSREPFQTLPSALVHLCNVHVSALPSMDHNTSIQSVT